MEFAFDLSDAFGEIMETVIGQGLDAVILQYPYNKEELLLFEKVATEKPPVPRSREDSVGYSN